MRSQLIFKRNARCGCGAPAGTCADIRCPKSLNREENKQYWIEGWALSKYSVSSTERTKIGKLVHDIKYQISDYTDEARRADADVIKNDIIGMIKWLYDPKNLPFDRCVSPISHVQKPIDLAKHICLGISGGSVTYLPDSISEKNALGSMKNISKQERCAETIGNYIFESPAGHVPKKGVLIVDDVFDTGCTIKGISSAISAKYPKIPIFVMTAAYIGHMGSIGAV